ncbi:Pantoate kinase [Candidatus Burarchaeum australiense]|nr:Pantoate kinase [Candidatus Burarchaeum australiense]
MRASAFAPGHVTGFFAIAEGGQGSTGAGFCVEKGLRTIADVRSAKANKVSLRLNGKAESLPTSQAVVKRFLELAAGKHYEISVEHKAQLPVGYGFGMSGAGALSLSLALSKALKTRLSALECARIAHEAEVECGTGLGTVVAERFGGFGIRTEPADFERFEKVKFGRNLKVVLAPMKPIETSKIIRDEGWKVRINGIGAACVRDLLAKPDAGHFISLSRLFATESGLAHGAILEAMRASGGSMAMLGESVFVLTETPKKAAAALRKFSKNVMITKISMKGARVS